MVLVKDDAWAVVVIDKVVEIFVCLFEESKKLWSSVNENRYFDLSWETEMLIFSTFLF